MHMRSGLVLLLLASFAFAGDLKVIVGFKGDADASVVKKHGAKAGGEIGGIDAMTATVPAGKLAKLRADPSVAYVEEDEEHTEGCWGGWSAKAGGSASAGRFAGVERKHDQGYYGIFSWLFERWDCRSQSLLHLLAKLENESEGRKTRSCQTPDSTCAEGKGLWLNNHSTTGAT